MDEVTTITIGPGRIGLAGVRDAARDCGTPLLWLLAGGAVPNERTLPALRGHVASAAVSVPLTRAGDPAEPWIGSFADDDAEFLLAAALNRRAPLRFTPLYSLLVPRDLVLSHDPPDETRFGPYSDIEWTARLFAERPGLLVPSSTVVMPVRRHRLAPRALLRLGLRSRLRRSDGLRQVRLACATRRRP